MLFITITPVDDDLTPENYRQGYKDTVHQEPGELFTYEPIQYRIYKASTAYYCADSNNVI